MRMRKKRNLEPRLTACEDVLLARGAPCNNHKEAVERYRNPFDFEKVFGNQNPVHLEVGCGNGGFILEMAKRNPDLNFFAVELCANVIVTAAEKIKQEGITNVRFLNIPAEVLPCHIHDNSIERVYLNFSTPLPEQSRERQRLTSARFLAIYRDLLKDGGEIVQKTDSEQFFDYSLQSYEKNGFSITCVTRDLHQSEWAKENIITEYEANFIAKGLPIFRAVAVKQ